MNYVNGVLCHTRIPVTEKFCADCKAKPIERRPGVQHSLHIPAALFDNVEALREEVGAASMSAALVYLIRRGIEAVNEEAKEAKA